MTLKKGLQRFITYIDYKSVITETEPYKGKTRRLKKNGGRDSYGKISVRRIGGGEKRLYREIDFKRDKFNIKAKVASIEYDPNRTSYIALLNYQDGEKRYIIAPQGLKVGDELISGEKVDVETGNTMPLKNIPIGTSVHNVELRPREGGQMIRSAGAYAVISSKERGLAALKLPSGEIRSFNENSLATIGSISKPEWKEIVFGKAGRKRHLGIRPKVRGVAMSPRDHPYGGGEGRSGLGMSKPKTRWGKSAVGKTRKKKKVSDKFILQRRK
ncbi:MAG: 50S ribosomal protein L2 [Candidatus Woykebacteria bacterium RBG_13_40_7b]|uniref:Large ribosomal subunit protein uL2 n=1 Tax=Candidatus Woykebacteria bacterium RBG_13_40_7b TaxID=1802594 RepID=A0A1G1W7Y3_9BACT|nr:MAG: 50S ribosomal protein L2 [Candidatus Woykebacteria bacterium RBG_13_40_7b]